jgi:hypothetical protein
MVNSIKQDLKEPLLTLLSTTEYASPQELERRVTQAIDALMSFKSKIGSAPAEVVTPVVMAPVAEIVPPTPIATTPVVQTSETTPITAPVAEVPPPVVSAPTPMTEPEIIPVPTPEPMIPTETPTIEPTSIPTVQPEPVPAMPAA